MICKVTHIRSNCKRGLITRSFITQEKRGLQFHSTIDDKLGLRLHKS